jgi:2-polyprenyl-6-methoxyphenol hydroxylase-like FAD-dependent oxidoreductase
MNLGWLDARQLADVLKLALNDQTAAPQLLAEYAKQRQRAAVSATRRAELFMALGCSSGLLGLRSALVQTLLSRPVAPTAAQLFTMRGLVT